MKHICIGVVYSSDGNDEDDDDDSGSIYYDDWHLLLMKIWYWHLKILLGK